MNRHFSRYIALLLALCLLLPLAACSTTGAPATTSAPVAPGVASENAQATPAPAADEPAPTPAPTSAPAPVFLPLSINEVMSSNKATIADAAGLFPDWVELLNYGAEPVSLSGLVLRADGSEPWALPDRTLQSGEYLLIFCDGSASDDTHSSFTLSKEGAALRLETAEGALVEAFDLPACSGDRSLLRDEEGQVQPCDYPTPGYENSTAGYEKLQTERRCDSPLQISEVMVYNKWLLARSGNYYDWVELKNVSGSELALGDYFLSDSGSDRAKFRLPNATLAPGETAVVYCCGNEAAGDWDAPFSLSAERDQLYLSRADGTLCDYTTLFGIPVRGSYGRMDGENGFFLFETPTPGAANEGGVRRRAETPVLLGRDGVFDGVDSVTVTLSAPGEIRYTTDGSMPNLESELYTGPLSLSATSVLRAVCFEPGTLISKPLELSYIINEGHTLPVVSLMAAPGDLFGGAGLYSNPNQEIERAGCVKFFENGQGFTMECGIKLHGATSKLAQEKKSFKLCFRSRYEGELHYDLFENGVCDFSSILLRAAQESTYSTLMRDNIVHQLAIRSFPALPAQDYKYAVLYINGRYWGVYNIREAHSDEHYAYHYGYDPDTVTQWKEVWDKTGPMGDICRFALNNNMANDANYEKVAERINVDSVIGWVILQAWCSNHDCNPPNARFYYSTEDEKMSYALVDLDLGMFEYDLFDVPLKGSVVDGSRYSYAFNALARKLMENKQFQLRMAEQLSAALHGPMADENVLEMINAMADEIRPEIARDRQRWAKGGEGDTAEFWEHGFQMVDYLRDYVTRKNGRAKQLISSFLSHSSLSAEEIEKYFGDIK